MLFIDMKHIPRLVTIKLYNNNTYTGYEKCANIYIYIFYLIIMFYYNSARMFML